LKKFVVRLIAVDVASSLCILSCFRLITQSVCELVVGCSAKDSVHEGVFSQQEAQAYELNVV